MPPAAPTCTSPTPQQTSWNATVTQSGGAATATNMSYNAAIATGATVAFGFNGAWTGTNSSPSSFALNGTTCTGGVSTLSP